MGLDRVVVTLLVLALSHTTWADEDFQYFSSSEVDYWRKMPPISPKKLTVKVSPSQTNGFEWNKYLDPKSDDFFKEGDYTPPAPFMEIARNPSDDNIVNWFRYLELKNALTHRLQERLSVYAASHGGGISGTEVQNPVPISDSPPLQADAKRFRLRLYFDSKCPHCARMMGTLAELSRMGFWVELRQIDSDVTARARIPFPVTSATKQELTQYHVEGVPLLLVGDLKQGTFFKIQGYQPASSVLQVLQSQTTASKGGHS